MMGTWYAVRGIEHNSTETGNSTKRTKSCPLINLTLNGDNIEFRWQSKDKPERKFELQINAENAGLWEYKPNKKGIYKYTINRFIMNYQNKNDLMATSNYYFSKSIKCPVQIAASNPWIRKF